MLPFGIESRTLPALIYAKYFLKMLRKRVLKYSVRMEQIIKYERNIEQDIKE